MACSTVLHSLQGSHSRDAQLHPPSPSSLKMPNVCGEVSMYACVICVCVCGISHICGEVGMYACVICVCVASAIYVVKLVCMHV
jgi:hypothetical protein